MYFLNIILLTLLLFGCDKRERSNPLDPQNLQSGGRPAAPVLYSSNDSVRVSWAHLRFSNATGFRIYRRLQGEQTFQQIKTALPSLFVYWDTDCEFEKDRWYKISVITGDFESILSDAVQVRPGPTFLWVTDLQNSKVTKYSHDGRHQVLSVDGFFEPSNIAVDTLNKEIWVSDFWDNRLKRINRGGRIISNAISLRGITDFAFDIDDNVVWVTSYNFNAVARFDLSGLKAHEISIFDAPREIALNTEKNSVFLAVVGSGVLVRLNYEGQILEKKSGFESILPMAYDQPNDRLWLGDLGNLIVIENATDTLAIAKKYSHFNLVEQIALDHKSGALWCIDLQAGETSSRVVKLSLQGDEMLVIEGFDKARSLAVSPYNSNCFVADATGMITELDGDTGSVLSKNQADGVVTNMLVQQFR